MSIVTLVVARAENGVIGRDGGLPWRITADLAHFRNVTMGSPMIMGRKTFESLPNLLAGRQHIVLTRDRYWRADGVDVAHSVEEALNLAGSAEKVSVIGGAEIYELFLPVADEIRLTKVHDKPDGDTVLPPFDDTDWRIYQRSKPVIATNPDIEFVWLKRRRAK